MFFKKKPTLTRFISELPIPRVLFAVLVAAFLLFPVRCFANPIYVYRDGKAIRFTSSPPPAGVQAQIFSGRSSRFSTVSSYSFRQPSSNRLNVNSFEEHISEASLEFGVDKNLIRAVIHAESGFNPRAVSPKGAIGLMQLMPGTARLQGVHRISEPRDNIRGGTQYLAQLIRRYRGNLAYSLAAYNAGEGAVEQYGGVPPYSETREYVQKVLALQSRYQVNSQGHSTTRG